MGYLYLILFLIISYRTTSKIYPGGLVFVSAILGIKPSLFQTSRGGHPFSKEKEYDSVAQKLNGVQECCRIAL